MGTIQLKKGDVVLFSGETVNTTVETDLIAEVSCLKLLTRRVESTNLSVVGYNFDLFCLVVIFKAGAAYQYDLVPSKMAVDLLEAKSVGKFFLENIREKYPTKKLPTG